MHVPDSTTPEPRRVSIRLARPLWIGLAAGVTVLVAVGYQFGLRSRDGTLIVTVNEPDAESGGMRPITAKLMPLDEEHLAVGQGWQNWPADAPPPAIAPFNPIQAKIHQAAWAKYLGLEVEYTNSIGMKFALIPPCEFTMGSTPAEIEEALKTAGDNRQWQDVIRSEGPQHKTILTQPFYLGLNEVTQADYEKVMGKNPSWFAPTGYGKDQVAGLDTTNHPVESLSWNDAAEFCAKLSQQEHLKPFYVRDGETVKMLDGTGYRLPTEAEWEFACRAGTITKYCLGDQDLDLAQSGWFLANSGSRTNAVGELKANPFGLHDMHGNVWEWIQDWWEPNYYRQFQEKPALDPNGPSSTRSQRVLRGGCWRSTATYCRASERYSLVPGPSGYNIGLRVSRVAGPMDNGEHWKRDLRR